MKRHVDRASGALTLAALAFALFAGTAAGDVPETLSYQGLLREADGTILASGSYDMTFRLYDQPAGGTPIWSEAKLVQVEEGVFSVVLGATSGIDLDFDGTYWISVQVGADPELPRVVLTSAPYARRAAIADSLAGAGPSAGDITAVGAGNGLTGGGTSGDVTLHVGAGTGISVTADQVALGATYVSGEAYDSRFVNENQANAVTAAMITPDLVGSVDGVANDAGNIDLVAGSNITITPNDAANTITIAATGGGTIGGSGTGDTIAKFTGANTIGNSVITESGSNVTIGTASEADASKPGGPPRSEDRANAAKLRVNGTQHAIFAYLNEQDAAEDGRTALYGYRTRVARNDGAGYAVNSTNNGVTGYNFWGDTRTFGVAGYSYNDYTETGGVLGAASSGDYWGALGFKDAGSQTWGIYTPNNAYIGGALRLPGGAAAGEFLTTDGSGNASWVPLPAGGDITGVTAGNGLTGGGVSGDVTLNVGAGTGISVAADAVGIANGGVGYTQLADPLSIGASAWDWSFTTGGLDIGQSGGAPTIDITNSYGAGWADCLWLESSSASASGSTYVLYSTTQKGEAGDFYKVTDDNVYAVYITAPDEGLYVSGDLVVAGGFTKSGVVETSQGEEAIFCVESPEVEIYASGTGRLSGGMAHVAFDRLFREAISAVIPVKVTVTPVGAWSGLYLESVSVAGFEVRSAAGDGEVEFHWMACGRREGCEVRPQVTIPDRAADGRVRADKQATMRERRLREED